MATSGMFDWNPMSQSQMDQAYLKSIIDANTGENYGARFGAGLGLSLGRMFGGQTAQEAEQAIMKEAFDEAAQAATPEEGAQIAIKRLRSKGLEGRARQLEAELLKKQEAMADIDLKKAQAQHYRTPAAKAEKVDPFIQGISTALGAGKITPANAAAAITAYQKNDTETLKTLGFETPEDKAPAYGAVNEATAKELYGTTYKNLTPEQAKNVNLLVQKREESAKAAGAGKPVDVVGILNKVGAESTAKEKAKVWTDAGSAYQVQKPMLKKLEEVERSLPRTFTGPLADTALQFGRTLSNMGIPVDTTKLANTEYLNSVSSQLVQTIAKNFPGSLAVKEMEQLIKSKPNSSQLVQSISRLIGDLRTEMQSNVLAYEKLARIPEAERYQKDFKYEQGQVYDKLRRYRDLEKAASTGKPMSRKDIEEAKQLQQELGV